MFPVIHYEYIAHGHDSSHWSGFDPLAVTSEQKLYHNILHSNAV